MDILNTIESRNLDNLLDHILNYEQKEKVQINLDSKDIILYGAGNLGVEAVDILSRLKIEIKYIIDKSKNKWGKNIKGIAIISPELVSKAEKENSIISICVVNFPYSKIEENLITNGFKHIISFWDMLNSLDKENIYSNGWYIKNLNENLKNNITKIYSNFSDNISKAQYIQNLFWRMKREEILFDNIKISMEDKFFPQDILPKFTDEEVFVDCGAYTGNTIKKFLEHVNCKFSKIIAFEPDDKNYTGLERYIKELDPAIKKKINIYDYAVDETVNKQYFISGLGMNCKLTDTSSDLMKNTINLDTFLTNQIITVLKIHTEGSEFNIVKGSINIIQEQRPILIITIYHTEETNTTLPLYLMNNLENYKFYNRLHAFCGIESVLYAIPNERI